MKAAIIAFAAILALSGAAIAGDKDARPTKPTVEPAQQEETVDKTTTGSIQTDSESTVKKPRVGIELNPFSFGTFH